MSGCAHCEDCKSSKWKRSFMCLGVVSTLTALIQSVLQLCALRISVAHDVVPYIWFFTLETWATIIYFGYTIRLLYLVRCRRCSDLSRYWWYFAFILVVINPAQSVWWFLNHDFVLLVVSLPATAIYLAFFVLVCRSITPDKFRQKIRKFKEKRRSRTSDKRTESNISSSSSSSNSSLASTSQQDASEHDGHSKGRSVLRQANRDNCGELRECNSTAV